MTTNSVGTIKLTNEEFGLAVKHYARKNNIGQMTVRNATAIRDRAIIEFHARSVRRAELLTEIDQKAFYARLED